jgi:hypothetical protein
LLRAVFRPFLLTRFFMTLSLWGINHYFRRQTEMIFAAFLNHFRIL